MPEYVEVAMHEYQQQIQQDPSMNDKNGKDQIMDPKLSGHPMRETNLSSHLKTEIVTKGGRKVFISCESS